MAAPRARRVSRDDDSGLLFVSATAMPDRRLGALVPLLLCPCVSGYTWSTQTTVCARMSGDQSNIWASSTNGFRWNFDLHVQFPLSSDSDYMEKTVRVEFRRPLVIERIEPQGSATAINGGTNFVEVEVSPAYVGHEYFSIQGFREGGTTEDMLSPTITCSGGADVPPPAPPHAADCDLAPEYGAYPLGGTREAGSDVTLKLTRWVPSRTFMLVYYGQEGLAVSKTQGVTIDQNPQVLGDGLVGFTFTLDPEGSAGLRCEGHPACIEFEVKPSPHHKPHVTCIESPPPARPSPPPALPPPVTESPPPAIASPSAPPPLGTLVHATNCALGGTARVVAGASTTSFRIAVSLDNWIDGYLVTLGVDGDAVEVNRAAHATPKPEGPSLEGAASSFTFALGEEPVEMAAFAVVLSAGRWGGLVAMSCSPPQSPPPPPVLVLAKRTEGFGASSSTADGTEYYGDEGGEDGDGSSYGDQPTAHSGKKSAATARGGGVGMSAALGGLLVLLTLGGGFGLFVVLRPGGLLRGMVERARAGSADTRQPPRKGRAKRADDGETESMVGASLDEDEEDARAAPTRAATSDFDFEAPPLAVAAAQREYGISLDDDDDDLQVGDVSDAPMILGRPEI